MRAPDRRHGHRAQGDAGPGGRARHRRVQDRRHRRTSGSRLDLYEKDLGARARRPGGRDADRRAARARSFRGARRVHRPGHRRGDAHRQGAARVPEPERARCTPGQLVTARIVADPKRRRDEVLAVPRSAVEQVEGKTVVFVKAGDGVRAAQRAARRLGRRPGRGPQGPRRRASRWPSTARSCSRASSCDEPRHASSSSSVRRRGVVLAIWAAVLRGRAAVDPRAVDRRRPRRHQHPGRRS